MSANRLQVWICTQCCNIPGRPDRAECILIRHSKPDEAPCSWSDSVAVWRAVSGVHFDPRALLDIGCALSEATTALIDEATGYLLMLDVV